MAATAIIGGLALGASVLGTGISAIGAVQSAQAESQAAAYAAAQRSVAARAQADAAAYNAAMQRQQAATERQRAAENARRQSRENRKRLGALRARGVSMDLLADNAMEGQLQSLTLLHEGELRAKRAEQGASLSDFEASNAGARARTAMAQSQQPGSSGLLAASGVLLGGAGNAAGMAYDMWG